MPEQFVYSVKKVLFVTNDFPPQSGGIETFISGLITQLPENSVVVHTSSQKDHAQQEKYDQQLFERFGALVVRDRQRILLPTPGLRKRVLGTVYAHGIDTVVFGSSVPLGLLAPSLRKRGVKKMVALTHGHEVWWSKVPIFSMLLRRVCSQVDVITYLGSFTQRAISRVIPATDRKKMVHLPPGVDVDLFSPGEKPEYLLERYQLHGKKIILCAGRLVQRKGQDVLIDALAILQKRVQNTHLLIVGTGNYENTLRKKVEKLKLHSAISFLGRVPYQELPDHFRLADIFASPTRDRFGGLEVEGLGIVYLEASACALPVIAGNSGGAPDAVQDGLTGLVRDGRNPELLAETLQELLENQNVRNEMRKKGREWMEREWSWRVIGSRFRTLLNS
jgi:phosphatidylinositol alpha-1,6-mannosyltransferase